MKNFLAKFIAGLAVGFLIGSLVILPNQTVNKATVDSTVKVQLENGHGSAVHIGSGYYVTAGHVVGDAKEVELITVDGHKLKAKVLWAYVPYDGKGPSEDIALLYSENMIQGVSEGVFIGVDVPSSPLKCSGPYMKQGEHINLFGNPLNLEFQRTEGHIAGRPMQYGPWENVYTIDATLLMGMSGGPTLNDEGEVIGINVGVLTVGQSITGIGVIVPSQEVCKIMAIKTEV